MKKLFICLAALFLLIGSASAKADVTDYDGKRMGIITGTNFEAPTLELFPNSEYFYYNSYTDVAAALTNNKIDGFLGDEPTLKVMVAEIPAMTILPELLTQDDYAFAFGKNSERADKIRGQFNELLAELLSNGGLDEICAKWFGDDESVKFVDLETGYSGENGMLNVVTTATDLPFSYVKDNKNVGVCMEIVELFCRRYGYTPVINDVDFNARIPGIVSGKFDMCASSMTITEERKESVNFSEPFYHGGIALAVRSEDVSGSEATGEQPATESEDVLPSPAEFNGKRIGVQTGTISGEVAQSVIPDIQLSYYNLQTDVLAALQANKIDAWCSDEPILRFAAIENRDLQLLDGMLDSSYLAAVFPKTEAGQALRDQYSDFVDQLWSDGTMQEIDGIWFSGDDSRYSVLDYEALPDTNGTLHMVLDTSILPFAFVKDGHIVGYDVDIAARFCQANGYRLKITPMDFAGVLPSLQSGKADFAACGITITEERAETMLFSSPTYNSGTTMAVLKKEQPTVTQTGVFTSLSQLNGKRIGVQTGTTFDEIVLETLPDAKISYFNTYPDMAAALEANKIDGFPGDEPVLQLMAAEDNKLMVLNDRMDSFEFGFVLPKTEAGEALLSEINVWLEEIRASGKLDEVVSKWTSGVEADKTLPDYASYPAPNGTLTLATEGAYAPMNYYRGDEVVGFEIDLAARFCESHGYGLKVVELDGRGLIRAVPGRGYFVCEGAKEILTENKMKDLGELSRIIGGMASLGVPREAIEEILDEAYRDPKQGKESDDK